MHNALQIRAPGTLETDLAMKLVSSRSYISPPNNDKRQCGPSSSMGVRRLGSGDCRARKALGICAMSREVDYLGMVCLGNLGLSRGG